MKRKLYLEAFYKNPDYLKRNDKTYRQQFYEEFLIEDESKRKKAIDFLDKLGDFTEKKVHDYKSATSKLNVEKTKLKKQIMEEKRDAIFEEVKDDIYKQLQWENFKKEKELIDKQWQMSRKLNVLHDFMLQLLREQEQKIIDDLEQEWLRVSTDEKFDIDEERTRGYLIAIRKTKKTVRESFKNELENIENKIQDYINKEEN